MKWNEQELWAWWNCTAYTRKNPVRFLWIFWHNTNKIRCVFLCHIAIYRVVTNVQDLPRWQNGPFLPRPNSPLAFCNAHCFVLMYSIVNSSESDKRLFNLSYFLVLNIGQQLDDNISIMPRLQYAYIARNTIVIFNYSKRQIQLHRWGTQWNTC